MGLVWVLAILNIDLSHSHSCSDGSCIRREQKNAMSLMAGKQWHTLEDWSSIRRDGRDEKFNAPASVWPETLVSSSMYKLLWQSSRTEYIAVLAVLIPFLLYFSAQGISKSQQSGTKGKPHIIPLSTGQICFKGFIICIPCLAAGYNLAVVGADVASIQSQYGISSGMVGWVAATSCIGCIFGALVNASLVDFVGRKGMHSYLTLTLFFGQLLMFAAPTFTAFLCGRLIMGAACGGLTALAPVYLAEIAPRKHRGLLVSCTEQGISGGLLFGFAATAFQSWGFREHSLAGLVFPVLTLTLSQGLAESPRWLIQKGQIEEATAILQLYMPDAEEVKHTLKAASECVAVNDDKRQSWTDSIQSFALLLNRNKQQLFIPALLMTLEEVVGIEVSDDYCVQFLQEAGVPHRSIVASATTAMVALKAIVLMISGCLIDRWGRKPSLLFSLGGQVVMLAAFAYLFTTGPWEASLAAWILYNLFYGAGLGNVCMVLMAEAFPDAKVRGVGCAFCYILNRLVAAIMSGIYPWQHTAMGVQNVFYLWSVSALIAFIFMAVFMKESSGAMLEHAA